MLTACPRKQVPLDLSKDMYVHQFEGFLAAVRTGDAGHLRCPYQTAAKVGGACSCVCLPGWPAADMLLCAQTYQASQDITKVANGNRQPGAWA